MRTRFLSTGAIAAVLLALSCTERTSAPIIPTEPAGHLGIATLHSISLSPSSASIVAGNSLQLTVTTIPGDASPSSFAWASSNAAVATVTHTGLVTAVAAGSATISASASGVTGYSEITVTAPESPSPPPSPPPSNDVVLVGAGDIASCQVDGDEATATLIDHIPGTVFTLGDNVYEDGTPSEFANCYAPTWGRQLARTRPSPGNHDYSTPNAAGYFSYFGSAAGDPGKGYYSYEAGNWHVIVLNSNLSCTVISCAAGSPQEQWLRADLAANTKLCTLAYWHHPRFNSGAEHGNEPAVAPLWNALYDYAADVILNGHEHVYERFAPQTPAAVADPVRGIRQFTVGTGGRSLYGFGTIQPNSEVRDASTFGVLKLTLHATSYDWQFIPVQGGTFTDSGTGSCH